MSEKPAELTVYYDGACTLCRAEIAHYKKQDGAEAISFVDVCAAEPGALGADLGREAALARFHVREPDGRLTSGAAGFARVWQVLPRWRWAARVARLPGVLLVLEGLYRAFLPLRPSVSRAFGRLQRWRGGSA